MFLQRSSCILCGEHIQKIKYNLKTTYSQTSHVLLIKFVEKLYNNIFLMHCNICSSCYDLLNELDIIQTREKELYTKLKNYISKAQGLTLELDTCINSTVKLEENEVSTFLDDDVLKIENIDLKKLPIKIKRISSDVAKTDEISKSLNSKPNSNVKNQDAFEKIQSSIQMDLSKHLQDHVNKYKSSKDVLCEICGQNFKTKSGYDNHIKKHDDAEDNLKILVMNKKDEDQILCNICGKTFGQKGALSRHLFIHSGQTRYQCEECGKKFVHNSSFNMHRKIHAGVRNFKCNECNKGFLSRSHLKRHLRAAHSGQKNHCCEYCGKKFAENYNLIAHVKVLHGPQEEILYITGEDNSDVFFEI